GALAMRPGMVLAGRERGTKASPREEAGGARPAQRAGRAPGGQSERRRPLPDRRDRRASDAAMPITMAASTMKSASQAAILMTPTMPKISSAMARMRTAVSTTGLRSSGVVEVLAPGVTAACASETWRNRQASRPTAISSEDPGPPEQRRQDHADQRHDKADEPARRVERSEDRRDRGGDSHDARGRHDPDEDRLHMAAGGA